MFHLLLPDFEAHGWNGTTDFARGTLGGICNSGVTDRVGRAKPAVFRCTPLPPHRCRIISVTEPSYGAAVLMHQPVDMTPRGLDVPLFG